MNLLGTHEGQQSPGLAFKTNPSMQNNWGHNSGLQVVGRSNFLVMFSTWLMFSWNLPLTHFGQQSVELFSSWYPGAQPINGQNLGQTGTKLMNKSTFLLVSYTLLGAQVAQHSPGFFISSNPAAHFTEGHSTPWQSSKNTTMNVCVSLVNDWGFYLVHKHCNSLLVVWHCGNHVRIWSMDKRLI